MFIQMNYQIYIEALCVIAKKPETPKNVHQLENIHIWKATHQ